MKPGKLQRVGLLFRVSTNYAWTNRPNGLFTISVSPKRNELQSTFVLCTVNRVLIPIMWNSQTTPNTASGSSTGVLELQQRCSIIVCICRKSQASKLQWDFFKKLMVFSNSSRAEELVDLLLSRGYTVLDSPGEQDNASVYWKIQFSQGISH